MPPQIQLEVPTSPLLVTPHGRDTVVAMLETDSVGCLNTGAQDLYDNNRAMAEYTHQRGNDAYNYYLNAGKSKEEASLTREVFMAGVCVGYLAFSKDSAPGLVTVLIDPITNEEEFRKITPQEQATPRWISHLYRDTNLLAVVWAYETRNRQSNRSANVLRNGAGMVSFLLNRSITRNN